MKTTDNTVLITGGTSGIGLGLALRFAQAGNRVVVTGRRQEKLDEIAAEHPELDVLLLDVEDPNSIAAAADAITADYPEFNVLINNAGIMLPEAVLDPEHLAAAESTITTNLLGPIRVLAALLPKLVKQDDGVLINVSSGLAFVPLPVTPTYNATKAAIHSWTQSLRKQLEDTPMQVIELVPPAVQTKLMNQEDSAAAMPLEDYLAEAWKLLEEKPDADEVLVERVKFLRNAEAEGRYDDVLGVLSAH